MHRGPPQGSNGHHPVFSWDCVARAALPGPSLLLLLPVQLYPCLPVPGYGGGCGSELAGCAGYGYCATHPAGTHSPAGVGLMILLAFTHAPYWAYLLFGAVGVAKLIGDMAVYGARNG